VGAAHSNPLETAATLKQAILENLEELCYLTPQQRRERRYEKFRQLGRFAEVPV
jgi:acetyl-CoA carboxylase carboxyl transferase subunit alpha